MFAYYTSCLVIGIAIGYAFAIHQHTIEEHNRLLKIESID
jgi:hypothetical protein